MLVCPPTNSLPGPLAALMTQPIGWGAFLIAFTAVFIRWRPEFLREAPPADRRKVAILHTMAFLFIALGFLLLCGVAIPWQALIEHWYSSQSALLIGTTCPLTPLDAAYTAVSREVTASIDAGAAYMFCGSLFGLLLFAVRHRARRAEVGAR